MVKAPFDVAQLPHQPGCYLYKNKDKKIIYVGKAKDLRKRVSQYFQNKTQDPKTVELVLRIADVDVIITQNEQEALLLEARLIRQHRPDYNIDLKENSTRYAYIELTQEEYPRLRTARKRYKGKTYFGPFVSGTHRRYIINFLTSMFSLRVCDKRYKHGCFYCHIGQCSGYPGRDITPKEYNKKVQAVKKILSGKSEELVTQLEQEMKQAAAQQEFEFAKLKRDQINALKELDVNQDIETATTFNQDVISYVADSQKMSIVVFVLEKGVVRAKQNYGFERKTDSLEEMFVQFLQQYYHNELLPGQILVSQLSQKYMDQLSEAFSEQAGRKVEIICPQRGSKRRLVEMVTKNAEYALLGVQQSLAELQKVLKLSQLPSVIECFDISTLLGKENVASMVQFVDGKPNNKGYRRYKIRTVEGQNDFASMYEVVFRRYRRLLHEKARLPDLVVIDGGKGQLGMAIKALQHVGVHVPIVSLAKREEEVYFPARSTPLKLSKKNEGLKVLMRIRDEAHRFAVTFHRLRRDKKSFE